MGKDHPPEGRPLSPSLAAIANLLGMKVARTNASGNPISPGWQSRSVGNALMVGAICWP